jgi:FK506-binding nuclear protein
MIARLSRLYTNSGTANKKGKPFSFKLGVGEVIKGWDVGVAGMTAGGERRLTIPAAMAYGKKGAPPDIPPNSDLIFDIKCISVG